MPRSVLHPCMHIHVYMHFLCMHLSAHPTTTYDRVLPHNPPCSTAYPQPQHSQLLACAEPFLSQLSLSKQHKEITILSRFLVIPSPPHSVKRLFSPRRATNNMLLSEKATNPAEKSPHTSVKHGYIPSPALHSLAGGMNSERDFWRHAGCCWSHDFGFLSQPCEERVTV